MTSLFLYIHSYLKVNNAFHDFVVKHKLDDSQFLDSQTWVNVLILSLLVAIILTGMFIIYVYYQKMIQLYRMQQNFINGFTHELKTPVASLRLFLDTFSKHELPREEQLKYLEYMKRDTDRLSDNVNLILNLAKIEDKKYKTNFEEVELELFVKELVEKYQHLFEQCDIQIEPHQKDATICLFDRSLMEMLLMNLLGNAISYNESENAKIKINFSIMKKHLIINIVDNGVGLAGNEVKNIFKKFYQVGKAAKGSGLGLYIAQQVARIHKGTLNVHSDGPGRGSTFSLKLPRAEDV
jgi:two-component system phosphate regulon sensor histidine kinase PhoR